MFCRRRYWRSGFITMIERACTLLLCGLIGFRRYGSSRSILPTVDAALGSLYLNHHLICGWRAVLSDEEQSRRRSLVTGTFE